MRWLRETNARRSQGKFRIRRTYAYNDTRRKRDTNFFHFSPIPRFTIRSNFHFYITNMSEGGLYFQAYMSQAHSNLSLDVSSVKIKWTECRSFLMKARGLHRQSRYRIPATDGGSRTIVDFVIISSSVLVVKFVCYETRHRISITVIMLPLPQISSVPRPF